MSQRTEHVDVLDAVARQMEALVGRTTELVEVSRGLALNHVLFSGTRVIPATGLPFVQLNFRVPMAAVAIGALKAVGDVVANAAPPGDAAPAQGVGVLVVPAGWHVVAPLVGPTLTVWGTAGDTVHLVVMSRLVPPSAGAGGAYGGTP